MTVKRDDGHPPLPIRSGTYRADVQPSADTPQARLIAIVKEVAGWDIYRASEDVQHFCKDVESKLAALDQPAVPPAKVRTADIAALILAEMVDAARMDRIRFDDEQRAFIAQALSDAVQETMNRVSAALDQTAPPSQTAEARAARVFETWDRDYKYPMAWEVRVDHLKRLIAEAIAAPPAEAPQEQP